MKNDPQERTGKNRTSISLPAEVQEQLSAITEQIPGTTVNSIGVEMIRAVISMADTDPQERTVPKVVRMIDAARKAAGEDRSLGNSETVLLQHYDARVTKAEAAEFWAASQLSL